MSKQYLEKPICQTKACKIDQAIAQPLISHIISSLKTPALK